MRIWKSHSDKKCKMWTLWHFLNTHSVGKYQKNEGRPFGDIKKISKISRNNRLGPTSFCFSDLEKSRLTSVPSSSRRYKFTVAVEATAYETYEICQFDGLEKTHYYSLLFLRKRRKN